MWRTRVTQQYGIDVPFIGAGMALIALPLFMAAVSNAGGLGVLGAGLAFPDGLRAMIREVKSMTSRPFGVDFVAHIWEGAHIQVCLEERVPVRWSCSSGAHPPGMSHRSTPGASRTAAASRPRWRWGPGRKRESSAIGSRLPRTLRSSYSALRDLG